MNEKSSGSRSRKQRLTAVGTRCADHVTPLYQQKLALTSPTGGGRSVGIVRVRTKATEFSLVLVYRPIRAELLRLCCYRHTEPTTLEEEVSNMSKVNSSCSVTTFMRKFTSFGSSIRGIGKHLPHIYSA